MTVTDTVLKFVEREGRTTAAQTREATGLKSSQVSTALNTLKHRGKVVRVNGGFWEAAGYSPEELPESGDLFEFVGHKADGALLVRHVTTHEVFAIEPI